MYRFSNTNLSLWTYQYLVLHETYLYPSLLYPVADILYSLQNFMGPPACVCATIYQYWCCQDQNGMHWMVLWSRYWGFAVFLTHIYITSGVLLRWVIVFQMFTFILIYILLIISFIMRFLGLFPVNFINDEQFHEAFFNNYDYPVSGVMSFLYFHLYMSVS